MDNRRKRKLTFVTIGLIFLLSGVEYGKISLGRYCGFFVLQQLKPIICIIMEHKNLC